MENVKKYNSREALFRVNTVIGKINFLRQNRRESPLMTSGTFFVIVFVYIFRFLVLPGYFAIMGFGLTSLKLDAAFLRCRKLNWPIRQIIRKFRSNWPSWSHESCRYPGSNRPWSKRSNITKQMVFYFSNQLDPSVQTHKAYVKTLLA